MLGKLKKYLWKRSFLRDKDLILRKKNVVNFDDAKSISIIYNASNEHEHHKVLSFARRLQQMNKSVRAIAYVGYNRLPHYCNPTLTWDFFTLKEINWFKRPDSIHIRDFLKVETDILIYLDQDGLLPLEYIAGLSRARFKAAAFNDKFKDTFDIMIDLKDKIEIEELMSQIVTYLKMINKKNYETNIL